MQKIRTFTLLRKTLEKKDMLALKLKCPVMRPLIAFIVADCAWKRVLIMLDDKSTYQRAKATVAPMNR